jgi:hypothetical protein
MQMKSMAAVALATSGLITNIAAGDAVEWRVADGGNGHWYEGVAVAADISWDAAKVACESRGGHLATLTSPAEDDFLWALASHPTYWVVVNGPGWTGAKGPWLGLHQAPGSPTASGWSWVTGEPFTWAHSSFVPNDGCTSDENALNYIGPASGSRQWNDFPGDVPCEIWGFPRAYIIEWSADCNNDGIVDYGQIRAGQLADSNANDVPDVCEAGIASCTPSVGIAPTIPLRDLDQGEGLVVGIQPDGTLVSWGSYTPTLPSGQFESVATGRNCAIAIRADGTLVGFGANEYGRLNVPSGLFSVVSAADASWHAAGIRPDGSLLCWGYNNNGQCNVPAGSYWAVAAGGHEVWSGFTVAVRSDGALAGWGNNTWGQASVPAGSNFRSVAAGYYHALALRNDNTIAGWGWNANGQSTAPSGQFVQVACGSNESVALRADGTVLIFGSAPSEVVSFFGARTDCTKVQITCCGGAVALVSTDCDSNGAFDAVEIAAQPASDQNANGVPDVCESTLLVPSQYPTIQAAIDAVPANSQRTVQVAAGTYNESFSLNGKDVLVRGAAKNATILDGTGLITSIAKFTGGEPATAGVESLVFRNGTAGSRFTPATTFTVGGAIFATNTAAHIADCRFENCRADYGGAVYQLNGLFAWNNCVFVDNTANDEGGAVLVYNCTGSVSGSSFASNRCGVSGPGSGSAFKAVGSNGDGESVVLDSCAFTGGYATSSGAAVEFYENIKYQPGVMRIVNTSITGNISGEIVLNGAAGLRILGRMQSCVLATGTNICNNTPKNVDGPYFIEGAVTVCGCAADITDDGVVNGGDLGVMLSNWGLASSSGVGDISHDGVVDGVDLAELLARWGICQ